MARLIKCPRCQAQIDVTTAGGGSTVKCPDCAVQVRVPSGETGKYQKVAEPAAAASSGGGGSGGKRGDTNFRALTPIMRKMAGTKGHGAGSRMPTRGQMAGGSGYDRGAGAKKGNNAPMIIGAAVAGVALLVVLVVMLGNNKPPVKPTRTQQSLQDDPASDNSSANNTAPEPDPVPAPGPGKEKEKPKPALQRVDGKYVAPATFERGASNFMQKAAEKVTADASVLKDAEDMLRAGKVKELQEKDYKLFPGILTCLLSDDEALARKAFEWLRDWCDYKKLQTEKGTNPINIELFNSAQWRGGCFMEWSEWFGKNGDVMDPNFANRKRDVNAGSIEWERFAGMLKGGGKGYDDEKRPEGAVMATLKGIKPRIAVENLAKLMDKAEGGEVDLMAANGINGALEYLTGQSMGRINVGNLAAIKKKWLEWAASQP